MSGKNGLFFLRRAVIFAAVSTASAWSQTNVRQPSVPDEPLTEVLRNLQTQVDEMRAELRLVRADAANARADAAEIKREVAATKAEVAGLSAAAADPPAVASGGSSEAQPTSGEKVQEDVNLLSDKLNEQYQTKVESGSRYRVRFHGLVVLNLFANRGNVDTIDNPSLALEIDPVTTAKGSIGGSLRQTMLGFQVFGPQLFGAKTEGDVDFDFNGGLPPTPGGETMGIVRLRTGTVRLDWDRTSVVAGQDGLFFYPLAPTSYASLSQPALAYQGNLWAWTPQVRVEHRFGSATGSNFTVQAGLLDPIVGAIPDNTTTDRPVGPGEQSRSPAVGLHLGWSRPLFGRTLSIGVGGYEAKQEYQLHSACCTSAVAATTPTNTVRSWMGSFDWDLPINHWLGLSGSMYRGSALGGLGGGLGQSVVFVNTVPGSPNPPADAAVRGLNTIGGWSQLKVHPLERLEWNFAVGQDNPFASNLAAGAAPSYLETPLARNRGAYANTIYRPRSDLVFALEFRHINSYPIQDSAVSANQLNLAMGIQF